MMSWRSFPVLVARLFTTQTPAGGALTFSISISSTMRTLFLACELLGALALAAVFASATGGARRKRSPPSEDGACKMDNFAEHVGRLVLFGIASALLASLPVILISKIRSRSFK